MIKRNDRHFQLHDAYMYIKVIKFYNIFFSFLVKVEIQSV